jgi:TonB family protein
VSPDSVVIAAPILRSSRGARPKPPAFTEPDRRSFVATGCELRGHPQALEVARDVAATAVAIAVIARKHRQGFACPGVRTTWLGELRMWRGARSIAPSTGSVMKLVCDTCGTKYSLDDSRVSGKAFKIRCKKCSGVILVRGALVLVPEPVSDPLPDARAWYAVRGGTQVGPMELSELQRRRATGELDDASLVWREGFDDWRALGSVEEARDVAPPSVEVAPEATDAPAAPRPALRSARNETSVLFTLGNLAKLAAPAAAASATGTEGSGLLDIRSLARTLAPAPSRAVRGPLDDLPIYAPVTFVEPAVLVPGSQRGRDRRLLWALAASMGMLAIVATILVVIVLRTDRASAHTDTTLPAKPAQPASGATASLTSAPAAPASPTATAIVQAAPATPATHPAPATTAAPSVAQAAPTSTPSIAPTVAAASTAHAAPTATAARPATQTPAAPAPPVRTVPSAARRGAARTVPAPSTTSQVEPATTPLQPQRAAATCSEVSCIVSSYADKCCEIYRDHVGGSGPPAPALPDSLDRAALAAGIARIDTSGCHDQSPAHGDVTVSVKVSPAGTVTAVTVKSSPDAALGACVTAAARKATFATTQRGGSFAYVWRF